jgi:hypothetical protein
MGSKKYICNTTCWVAGLKKAMFMPGDIVGFLDEEEVPGHFTCIEPEQKPELEPVKEELKFEEFKVENPKVEEVKVEPFVIEPKEEVKEELHKRKPKRFGE